MSATNPNLTGGQYHGPTGDLYDPDTEVPVGIPLYDPPQASSLDVQASAPAERCEQQKEELRQVEEDIRTLQQVLAAKYRRRHFLRQQLGITVVDELRTGVHKGMENLRSSEAYQKTSAAVKMATVKTTSTLQEKWNVLKQTPAFKSFEDKLGNAYQSVRWSSAASQLALVGPSLMGKLVRSSTLDTATGEPSSLDLGHTQAPTAADDTTNKTNTALLSNTNVSPSHASNNNRSGHNRSPSPVDTSTNRLGEFDDVGGSDETDEFVQATDTALTSTRKQPNQFID